MNAFALLSNNETSSKQLRFRLIIYRTYSKNEDLPANFSCYVVGVHALDRSYRSTLYQNPTTSNTFEIELNVKMKRFECKSFFLTLFVWYFLHVSFQR